VVVNAGSPVRMDWAERVPAILHAWYPGMAFGDALADVLLGAAEPGGRLPLTFPRRAEDAPSYLNYPGEGGRARRGTTTGCYGSVASASTRERTRWPSTASRSNALAVNSRF
jgi:hypothetical protein